MVSKSKFFLLAVILLFLVPLAIAHAQTGGTEQSPTPPPPTDQSAIDVLPFRVFLPALFKVTVDTDIAISEVQLSANPVAKGDTVHFTFIITNLGSKPAVEFPVEWNVLPLGETEPLASGSFVVPGLVYGQVVTLEADYVAAQAGPFDVQVVADPFFQNLDPLPSNNTRSVELGVTGIVEFCGTITKDTVWAYATYVVDCETTLPDGINWLMRSGAVVKPTRQQVLFNIYGTLEMNGTETLPVVITSINDESYGADANGDPIIPPNGGEWNKFYIGSTGVVNASHALLRYGIIPFWSDQGHLTLSDSVLEYFFAATQSNNGFINLQNNTIRSSGNYGLIYYNNGPFLAAPTMINNHFEGCTSYAVSFGSYYEYTLDTSQVYGNTATYNGFNGIQLRGVLGGDSILTNAGIPYIVEDDMQGWESLYVPSGAHLTIQAGTIFKLALGNITGDKGTGLEVAGTLQALGTEAEPIIFTSLQDDSVGGDTNNDGNATTPMAGDWTRMLIHQGAVATFEYVAIQYGGGQLNGQSQESVRLDAGELHLLHSFISTGGGTGIRAMDGVLDVQDSTISNNGDYGIYYSISSAAAPTIKDNAFENNSVYAVYFSFNEINLDANQVSGNSATGNGTNGIYMTGTLLGNSTLGQGGIPYILVEDDTQLRSLYVPAGSTLTINPGATFKMTGFGYYDYRGTGLQIAGELYANGTEDAPIIFTSIHDDEVVGDTNNNGTATGPTKGDWLSNLIQPGGSATFDHCTVKYAGGSSYGQTAESIKNDGGTLHFHDGLIDAGAGSGIRNLPNSLLDVTNSTIMHQGEHGIYYAASGPVSPIIHTNIFQSNGGYGIYFDPSGDLTLDGTQISGNSASGNGFNALRLIGTLTGSSTLQNPGFAILLDYNRNQSRSLRNACCPMNQDMESDLVARGKALRSNLQQLSSGETSNKRPIYFTNPNIFPNTRSISLHV